MNKNRCPPNTRYEGPRRTMLLTPHMAGYGPHLNERRFQIIQDNCRAFANGEPLQ